jgi:chromosome segregation ATPase
MTADGRLDQLEPLMSESMAILDRHTAQLKQLNNSVAQLLTAASQQADTSSFLLREQLAMKADIVEIKVDIAGMKTDIAGMKTDIEDMKTDITGVKTEITGINSKLDLIVQLLQSPGN